MATLRTVVRVDLAPLQRFRAIVSSGLGGGGGSGTGTATGGPFDDWRKQSDRYYSTAMARRFDQYSRGGGDWPALAASTAGRRPGARKTFRRGHAWNLAEGNGTSRIGAFSSLVRDTSKRAKERYGPLGKLVSGGGRQHAILVRTGVLKRALPFDGVGHRATFLPNGIQIGFMDVPHGSPLGRFQQLAQARKAARSEGEAAKKRYALGGGSAGIFKAKAKERQILAGARAGTARRIGAKHAAVGSGEATTIGRLASIHHFGTKTIPARTLLVEPDAATLAQISGSLQTAVRRSIAIARGGGK